MKGQHTIYLVFISCTKHSAKRILENIPQELSDICLKIFFILFDRIISGYIHELIQLPKHMSSPPFLMRFVLLDL